MSDSREICVAGPWEPSLQRPRERWGLGFSLLRPRAESAPSQGNFPKKQPLESPSRTDPFGESGARDPGLPDLEATLGTAGCQAEGQPDPIHTAKKGLPSRTGNFPESLELP